MATIPTIEQELTNSRVNSEAEKIWREALAQFPEVKVVWCYSASTSSDHRNGRCLDLMVTYTGLNRADQIALGDRIRKYFILHANRLHVQGIIWNGKVTGFPIGGGVSSPDVTYSGPAGVARTYSGSDKHYDHVHVQVSGAKVTTWLKTAPFVWDGKSFPGADRFQIGSHGDWVTLLGQRLVIHGWAGYLDGPGPDFSATDQAAVKWFQEKQGWTGSDADGIPGPLTWELLMANPKPVVNVPIPAKPPVEVPVETPPAVIPPTTPPASETPSVPVTEPKEGSQEPGIIDTTKCPEDETPATPVVPSTPATPPPPAPKPTPTPTVPSGISEFVGVSLNAAWPGFSSTQAKMKSWSTRLPILIKKVKDQKPRVVLTQEMGQNEAADFYGRLGTDWEYQRFGPLNTVGWDKRYFTYVKTLEIDTPDYGQYPGRGYVEAWLKDKEGNRLRLGSGHNPVKTAADSKYQEATIQQIVSNVNNEDDDWPLIWGDDTNNRQSKDVGMWAILKKYGYDWVTSGIDAVLSNFGAVVTKKSVVDLGDGSDHNMLVFTGRTTKK